MNPRPFISYLLFVGGRQARIRGDVVHIQLHLLDLRLHILLGRDIPRGGFVAFRKLNVVEIHGNTFVDIHVYLLYHTRSIDGVDHFIYSFRSRRRSGKHFFGAVFVCDTERNFGALLDPGFEDVRSIRLVFYLAAETVGDRRNQGGVGCDKPGLNKFAPIDTQICSVRVRPRSYDIRNALFGAVPFPDKLLGDIVAGADLQVVHRFVSLLLGHEVREAAHLGVVIGEFLVEGVGDDRRVGVRGQADATQVGCESIVSSFQSRYRYPEGCCIRLVFGILFLYLRPLLSHGGFFLFG